MVVKTCITICYRHSTGFAVLNTCIMICYVYSTGFAVVKTGLPNIYKPSTSSAVVKSDYPTSTGLQHDLLYFKLVCRTSCSASTVFSVIKICIQHLHTGLAAVKKFLPNYHKPSTAFVAVKTRLTNYYRCLTNFAGDKKGLTIAYRASTALKKSKRDYETSPGLWKSKMSCQASTVPQQALR